MLRQIRKMPLTALFGFAVIFTYAFVAIFAPVIAPYPETAIVGPEYMPWSDEFTLGTDNVLGLT